MLIGADLALNHGSLVDVNGNILCYYEDGKGMMSGSDDLYAIAQLVSRNTPYRATVIIDFDRKMGNWGGVETAILMTMLISFYGALAQVARKCEVHFVTPALVRYCMGHPETMTKKDLHAAIKEQYNMPDGFPNDKHGDLMDAWLLCQAWACASKEFQL